MASTKAPASPAVVSPGALSFGALSPATISHADPGIPKMVESLKADPELIDLAHHELYYSKAYSLPFALYIVGLGKNIQPTAITDHLKEFGDRLASATKGVGIVEDLSWPEFGDYGYQALLDEPTARWLKERKEVVSVGGNMMKIFPAEHRVEKQSGHLDGLMSQSGVVYGLMKWISGLGSNSE